MNEPVVVDSNVLISALVSDSLTRRLVTELDARLAAPQIIADEVERNIETIAPRSDLPEREIRTFLRTLFEYVDLVPRSTFEATLDSAKSAMGG